MIGETEALRFTQIHRCQVPAFINDDLEVLQEPRIDRGCFKYFFYGPVLFKGGLKPEDAFGIWHVKHAFNFLMRRVLFTLTIKTKAKAARLQRA